MSVENNEFDDGKSEGQITINNGKSMDVRNLTTRFDLTTMIAPLFVSLLFST